MSERISNEELGAALDELFHFINGNGDVDRADAAYHVVQNALAELAELRAKQAAPPLGSDERAALLMDYIDFLWDGMEGCVRFAAAHGYVTPPDVIERGKQLRARIGRNDDGTWSDPPPQPEREVVPVEDLLYVCAQAEAYRIDHHFSAKDGDESRNRVGNVRAWLARREGKG